MFRNLNIQFLKITMLPLASMPHFVTIPGMYATDTILTFAFPAGRLGGIRFRISFFFPVLALALIWRLQDVAMGLLATSVVLFSVLIHELTHLLVARSTSGDMDEIRIWPLGGLTEPYGRGYLQDHVHTMMSGPVANLMLALTCLLTLNADQIIPLLNPFVEFAIPTTESFATTAWRMAFLTNWILFLVNMIPIAPFDNGVLFRTYLTTRFTESESRDLVIRLGLVVAIFGMLAGFVFDLSGLVMVSAFVAVIHIHDSLRWYETQSQTLALSQYDQLEKESLEDYWFDEQDSPFEDDTSSDALDRWRVDREQELVRREQEEREREEEQMDNILQKVHQSGRESLTSAELHILNRVSDRIRNRRQHS